MSASGVLMLVGCIMYRGQKRSPAHIGLRRQSLHHLRIPLQKRRGKCRSSNPDPIPNPDSIIITQLGDTPSTVTPADQKAALMVLVKECGVYRPECVDVALSNGMTPDQIRDVVAIYRAAGNAGRWKPGILFDRLSRPGAFTLKADQGWYGDADNWTAQRTKVTAGNP
ncbi:hypothetical protein GC163_20760 [bacterium]|nr:hypothetical protein [bacterium]